MATATAGQRPRISQEFLKANTCERVLAGTAKAIAEKGYCAATVADCVSAAGTARNTFYDCYGSKEEAALAIVDELLGRVDTSLEAISKSQALDVLLIEPAAVARNDNADPDARRLAAGAKDLVEWFAECELVEPPPPDDPRQQSLPPGRNTLPAKFKADNQRTRLLCGLAAVIERGGYGRATIALVCKEATVSRRTFYEHFGCLADAAKAMVATSTGAASGFVDMAMAPTLPALVDVGVEILAQRLVKGRSPLVGECLEALPLVVEAGS